MDGRTERNVDKWKTITGYNVGIRAGHYHIPFLQALRGKDIALLTIQVMQPRQMSAPVGIVLNCHDSGRNSIFKALEINDPITPLVASSPPAHRNLTVSIPTADP